METSYMKEEAGHKEFLAGENVFKAVWVKLTASAKENNSSMQLPNHAAAEGFLGQ